MYTMGSQRLPHHGLVEDGGNEMCLKSRDKPRCEVGIRAPKGIAIIAKQGALDVEEQKKVDTRVGQLVVVHLLVLSFSSRQPLDGLNSTKIHSFHYPTP